MDAEKKKERLCRRSESTLSDTLSKKGKALMPAYRISHLNEMGWPL